MSSDSLARIASEKRRLAAEAQRQYRDRALKVLPHICACCGREFEGKRLKELTVHHKDHNYKNNPGDGSNWELLCMYCHDYEHERHESDGVGDELPDDSQVKPSVFSPFEGLDALLGSKKEK